MSRIHARGTTNGSAYAMWSVRLYGTCKSMDHGCTSCPTSMMSLRSQPLSNASLLKNTTREQHECTHLMHSDLDVGSQGTSWVYMQFSGSFDWCILMVHHTDMPTSQYPLQRAGVDVE